MLSVCKDNVGDEKQIKPKTPRGDISLQNHRINWLGKDLASTLTSD